MEYLLESKQDQKSMERFVLIVYSIYGGNLCLGSVLKGWDIWIAFFIFGLIAAAWMVHLAQWKQHRVRILLLVSIIQFTVLIYACHTEELSIVITTLLAINVLIAFLGELGAIWVTAAATVMILLYHTFIMDTFSKLSSEEYWILVFQAMNLCMEYVMLYIWVKKRNESTERMFRVIGELREAEQSKDDFLSNVSHEIRTPINTICGMSEIALREKNLEKIREEVIGIQDAGRNLTALVNDILDFSQLQSGKMDLEEEQYNITSTINDIIGMAMAKKEEKSLEFIVDCDAGIPRTLLGDEKKIRRVIMNLVDNAIKFTPEGCVGIHIAARKESYGVNLMVSVTDTGIGIREENIEKLFLSFTQMDTRRNRQEGGVGLGLAISKALIKKMGGNIAVQSKYGKGTEFRFVVPQKVVDNRPIARIENRKEVHIATYINMEQFSIIGIRDEYSANIRHMVEQMQVKCNVCRNLAELKRRDIHEKFSHVFISMVEYREDTAYFDELAERTKLVIVIDRADEKSITNAKILRLYKPFFILPAVSIINGSVGSAGGRRIVRRSRFVAPEAHVLVVDDNLMNIRVIEGLLKEYKIKVSTAMSGLEALDVVESKDYDFIFMDHMMPEMDGIETFHRIRDKVGTYYKKIPVIALTANVAPGIREMFLEEGFVDFVSKPVEISVLERVLKRILPEEKIIFREEEVKTGEEDIDTSEAVSGDDVQAAREEIAAVRQEAAAAQEETAATAELETEFGLDMEKGMLYCGGEESYFQVLAICCKDCAPNIRELDALLGEADWKNYTIKIHALKGNMNSIGALALGNLAKEMEMAARNEDGDFIRARHGSVMESYRNLVEGIKTHPKVVWEEESAPEEPEHDYPEMEEEKFDDALSAMEDAMFEQDGEKMLKILEELRDYAYHGKPLAACVGAVQRKIEMADYMSALDLLSDTRKELQEKGGK